MNILNTMTCMEGMDNRYDPVPIVFNLDQANEAFRQGKFQVVLAVRVPSALFCGNMEHAREFFK